MNIKALFINSANVLLNNYIYQFLIIFFFLKGDFILISEITFLIAPLIFLKDSLSSNQRTLLISDRKLSLHRIFIKQRIFYILIIFILYLFFFYYFYEKNENILLIFIVTFLLNFSWLNELNLTHSETTLNTKKIITNLIILILFYVLIISYIFSQNPIILYILGFKIIYLITKIFLEYNIQFSSIFFNIIKFKISFNYKLLSTLSINSVNLIWRIFFFLYLEKEFAGVLFSIFAFMSFPSSFYNNTIGMTLEKNFFNEKKINRILILYYILIFILIFYTYNYKIIPLNNPYLEKFAFLCFFLSFFGSLIMIFSISKRIKIINYRKSKRNILFKIDIAYAFTNLLSLLLIYQYFNSELFYILLFTSSIFSLFYYFYYKKLKIDEIG